MITFVNYLSDVDQDFDDDPFVESQSDVEETVTVVKKTTTCEICGVALEIIRLNQKRTVALAAGSLL